MAEKPITVFPITMDVQEGSLTEHKTLNKYAAVQCRNCGKKIVVSEDTAVMVADDVPAIRCPNCEYTASVLYYFPKKGGRQFARAKHW
jgi:DNA-directed RNA polymerase subunit RPC12/RpoP